MATVEPQARASRLLRAAAESPAAHEAARADAVPPAARGADAAERDLGARLHAGRTLRRAALPHAERARRRQSRRPGDRSRHVDPGDAGDPRAEQLIALYGRPDRAAPGQRPRADLAGPHRVVHAARASGCCTSSRASRSRTPSSNASIGRIARRSWTRISFNPRRRPSSSPMRGSSTTTSTGRTTRWAVCRRSRTYRASQRRRSPATRGPLDRGASKPFKVPSSVPWPDQFGYAIGAEADRLARACRVHTRERVACRIYDRVHSPVQPPSRPFRRLRAG